MIDLEEFDVNTVLCDIEFDVNTVLCDIVQSKSVLCVRGAVKCLALAYMGNLFSLIFLLHN